MGRFLRRITGDASCGALTRRPCITQVAPPQILPRDTDFPPEVFSCTTELSTLEPHLRTWVSVQNSLEKSPLQKEKP